MIQGAKTTSTNEMVGPRKKGPVMWEALTRSVMADCRAAVSDDCLSGREVVRRESKEGMMRRLIWVRRNGSVNQKEPKTEKPEDERKSRPSKNRAALVKRTYVVSPHPTMSTQLWVTEREEGMTHTEVLELAPTISSGMSPQFCPPPANKGGRNDSFKKIPKRFQKRRTLHIP